MKSAQKETCYSFCATVNSEFLDHVGKRKSNSEFHTTYLYQRHTWKCASLHISPISFSPIITFLCPGVPTLLLEILQSRNCLAKDFMISQGCNIIQLAVFLFKTTPQLYFSKLFSLWVTLHHSFLKPFTPPHTPSLVLHVPVSL